MKRLVNTQVIYPPANGTAEALLAYSSASLDERQEALKITAEVA